MTYQGLIHRYRSYLDLPAHTQIVSLNEGNTPLIPMPRLGREFGCDVFIKYEGLNPTGSFKDRGMTAAISEALGRGAKTVICASTGNTSASLASYAAASQRGDFKPAADVIQTLEQRLAAAKAKARK